MAPARSSGRSKGKQSKFPYAKIGGGIVAITLLCLAGMGAQGSLSLLFEAGVSAPVPRSPDEVHEPPSSNLRRAEEAPVAQGGDEARRPLALPQAPAEAPPPPPLPLHFPAEAPPPPPPAPRLDFAEGGSGGDSEAVAEGSSKEAEAPKKEGEEWASESAGAGGAGGAQWIFCSGQWQDCLCGGTVRWGNRDKWKVIELKKGEKLQQVKCSIDKLGDPFPGDDGKHCQCEVTPGSVFYNSLNPGLLPTTNAKLATSCEKFRKGATEEGEEGRIQWESVAAFCDPNWGETEAGKDFTAGPRALSSEVLQGLMDTWVDHRFVDVHEKYFGKTGWLDRCFINYYAGPPNGKHAGMTQELVASVHAFSDAPVVVFHFGVLTPESWTKEKFPRLILLHAKPMPANAGRSFNFNKMRAMLLTKARVGIQLDSDQFVAPGVDAMFKTTEREVTKEYPMPILPAHFLDRTPRDTGKYWARYCPKDNCKWQSQRWGHAHPTWTFWALPWLSRWLRGNLRDETLPAREGGSMSALRIVDVPEDEDLLNIGTWEDGGTKQWCKLDLPGPGDFSALLRSTGAVADGSRCNGGACGDITSDGRWHPQGVAKVFYTAHHAVDPAETRRYIKALSEKQKEGKLPPPILYKGNFYKDGDSLRAAHPEITCII